MQPNQPQPTREDFIKGLFQLEPKDNIYSAKEARTKITAGITKGVDAIKASYGAAGSNAIVEEDLYPFSRTTNDGKAILHGIKLADPVEQMGLNILREVADKQDREGGDGRKTAVVLTGAILEEGAGLDTTPMELKRSLDECLPAILKSIDEQTKQIIPGEVGAIATIAGENEALGNTFQEIYQQIGKDGIIELDNSNLPETFYEITEGVRLLNCGFTYPYMANEDKGRKAVYKNPYILITKQKIATIDQLDKIMKAVYQQGRTELVIFCDEIDISVSTALAQAHMTGIQTQDGGHFQFKTLVIKAPTLWKDWLYEDFAKITGAKIVDPAQGITLKNFQLAYLGICDKIITSKDETVVLGTKDISDHIKVLGDLGTDDAQIRLARLKTKTAILKLGANSETELSYVRGKALDARNASYLALNSGIVPGGGVALMRAIKDLPDTIGGKVLAKALKYPIAQIAENMEVKVPKDWGDKVLDPANVVKSAISNALSVASTVLTTKLVITKAK